MVYLIKNKPVKEKKAFDKYDAFNDIVAKKMKGYAEKRGWKLSQKGDNEPVFRKGKKEVVMHTGDAVIFGTINNKFEDKSGKLYAKHYPQSMPLFLGKFSNKSINKYIQQGKATLNQLDKKSENE